MDEFKFVMKCFLFACGVLALTQLKTNGVTIESRIQSTLLSTPVADFVNKTALGGISLYQAGSVKVGSTINNWLSARVIIEPETQIIRDPAAKKTVDNSDLRKNDKVSPAADFGYDSEIE